MTTRTPAENAKMLRGLVDLIKSMPESDLKTQRDIEDMFDGDARQKNPSAAETLVGPAVAASGAGAAAMVPHYSDFTAQQGLTKLYSEFDKMLTPLASAMKAQSDSFTALTAALTAKATVTEMVPVEMVVAGMSKGNDISRILRKAKTNLIKAEDEGEEDEDKKEGFEKAASLLDEARTLITKAEEDAEDEEEEKATEKARAEYRNLRKSFKKVQEARTAKAAPSAVVVEPVVAAKAVEHVALDKAMGELKILQTTVHGLMETVAGKSMGTGTPPVLPVIKGLAVDSISEALQKAADNDEIDGLTLMKAKGILSHLRSAQAGNVDAVRVQTEIEGAPESVRRFFQAAA